MTHKQLVDRMRQWVQHNRNFPVVITELRTRIEEVPDVLGFHSRGDSMLVECKVSRADFFADADKRFRVIAEAGVGDERFFAAPQGVLRLDDLPAGWGFIEVDQKSHVRLIRESEKFSSNKRGEVTILASAIRRLEIATAVFVRADEPTPAKRRRKGEAGKVLCPV